MLVEFRRQDSCTKSEIRKQTFQLQKLEHKKEEETTDRPQLVEIIRE
jgi:hypothetical protein